MTEGGVAAVTEGGYDPIARARELFDDVPWRRFVAVGDSITEGMGDPVPGYPDKGWPQMVADGLVALRSDLEYLNLGRRYLTTRQIRETQLAPALEFEPDLVTVLAGGNDMFVESYDPSISEREFDAMVSELAKTGATVVTMTMFDIFKTDLMPQQLHDMLKGRFDALNEVIRKVARRYELLFIDFAEFPECADKSIYSADLRHGNMKGHAVAAEAIFKTLAEHAATLQASR